MTEKNSEQG